MQKYAYVLIAMCAGAMANAQLFNNAAGRGAAEPFGLGTDVRGAGGWYSRLQTTQTTFGAGAQGGTTNNRVADDFSITGPGWNITTANFFMYQTGATAVTINGGTFQIMTGGTTGPDGNVVATGTFASAALTDIFRTVAAGTDETRRIQQLTVNFNTTLGAGNYWMVWSATGSLASGPWQPAITIAGLSQPPGSANAMQSLAGAAFAPITDAGVGQDLPFIINGQPVPEPASMAALGLGALALIRRRRASKK